MKKQILIGAFLLVAGVSSFAQCGKKSTLSASATNYYNSKNELQRTVEETTTVEFDGKGITITPGEHTMEGTVDSVLCDWKVPYKEGKTVLKGNVVNPGGQDMSYTISIEGKDGKLTLLFEAEQAPDRKIKLNLDKFEEKK